jgi:hypothetical protein
MHGTMNIKLSQNRKIYGNGVWDTKPVLLPRTNTHNHKKEYNSYHAILDLNIVIKTSTRIPIRWYT